MSAFAGCGHTVAWAYDRVAHQGYRRNHRPKGRVPRLTTCPPSRFGSYDFDLDEDLGPDELWDDLQHRRRARLTEIARANFCVSRNIVRSRQILRDLYDISNGHTGLSQDADNMLPREFSLAGNVFGETTSIYRKAGRSRSHQPAQIRLSLDGIAIAADLARNSDIVNRVRHSTCSFSALTECRATAGGHPWGNLDSRQGAPDIMHVRVGSGSLGDVAQCPICPKADTAGRFLTPHSFRGVAGLDNDRRRHARVQRAEIFVSTGLREGEGKAIVGVERLRLKQPGCRGDSVRYVVLVAPSHRRSRLHREAGGYEGKIIDFGGCVFRTHRAGKKDDRRQQTSDAGRDSRIA